MPVLTGQQIGNERVAIGLTIQQQIHGTVTVVG
jgi:hypothetical protein